MKNNNWELPVHCGGKTNCPSCYEDRTNSHHKVLSTDTDKMRDYIHVHVLCACAIGDVLPIQHLFHSIPDPPTAMVGITEEDKEPEFSHVINEEIIPPSFSCFYNGHPSPSVTWTLASGEPLPSSIKQNKAKMGILQLQFTSALAYSDPVEFVCTASNALETAQARLELVIRGE